MDERRKRVIGIMAAILASLHMETADDLFGTPQGSPRTDKLIALPAFSGRRRSWKRLTLMASEVASPELAPCQ
jgi:hypothetical protein